MAMNEQNFEFATNMWVAESFCEQNKIIKSTRRHARMRFGEIKHRFIDYFVRLEEGEPPKDYYGKAPKSPHRLLEEYVQEHRSKTIYKW